MNVKASRSKGLRESVKRKCKVDDGKKREEMGGTLINYTSSNVSIGRI